MKIEQDLSQFLKVPVHVGRVSFSLRRLTLHQVSFGKVPLNIRRLRMEGSLLSALSGKLFQGSWQKGAVQSVTLTGLNVTMAGVPLQAEGRLYLTGSPGTYMQVEGELTVEHRLLKAEVEVGGRALQPVVFGWVEDVRGVRRHFSSQWEFRREAIRLSRLELQGGWNASGELAMQPKAHALIWVQREGFSPEELSVTWSVGRSQLEFEAGLSSKQASLAGEMGLHFPYWASLALSVNGLELGEVAHWLPGNMPSKIAGRVQGQVSISGSLNHWISSGDLLAAEGRFGFLEFTQIALRFHGKGPILQIENSQLSKPTGTLLMEGMVDLRRIGHPDFFQAVKLTPLSRNLEVAGWQMSPTPGSSGLQIKRPLSDQDITVGLSYKSDAELPRQDQQGEFLVGIEHRKKF